MVNPVVRSLWIALFAIILFGVFIGVLIKATDMAPARGDDPADVRVQHYVDYGYNCLIFTHDTGQGAAVAVSCT